jgi:hypothetical protein
MSRIRLKFVHQWVDNRNGGAKARYYFRRPGFKRISLPGLPGSDEFMDAYRTALAGQALPRPMIGASRTKAGSVSALIVTYLTSADFLARPPSTQTTYRNILERFRREHGDKPVTLLTRQHINAMLAQKVSTPAAANHWLRLVKVLMQLAVEEGYRKDNPTIGIKRIKNRSDGFHTWDEGEIAAFNIILLEATHGWRWRCCSIPRSAVLTLCAWAANISGMVSCMSGNKRPVPCWQFRCTLPLPPLSRPRRALT